MLPSLHKVLEFIRICSDVAHLSLMVAFVNVELAWSLNSAKLNFVKIDCSFLLALDSYVGYYSNSSMHFYLKNLNFEKKLRR